MSDSSTYDSLVNLVQRGFVDGQGNWGRYGLEDSRAAAYRYTECKANDSLNSIFEKFLNFVPWEPLELIIYPIPNPIRFNRKWDYYRNWISYYQNS